MTMELLPKCEVDASITEPMKIKQEQFDQSEEFKIKYTPDQDQLDGYSKISSFYFKCDADETIWDVETVLVKQEQCFDQDINFEPDYNWETAHSLSQSNATDSKSSVGENPSPPIKTELKEPVTCKKARNVECGSRSLDPSCQGKPDHRQFSSDEDANCEQGQFSEDEEPGRRASDIQHMAKSINGRKTYCCEHCTYTTTNSTNIRVHIGTHTKEKPFKCTVCTFICSNGCNLKAHMMSHSKIKPHKCTLCPFSSSRADSLKRHIKTHTGKRPYECPVCSFTFSQGSLLKTHMMNHTGNRPFKCTVCPCNFIRAGDLKKHMTIHLGIKPFKCKICSFSFSRSSHLKTHMRNHIVKRPHKCTVCSYSCIRAGQLKRHMTLHSGTGPELAVS